jgi:hypothetical protein
MNQVGRAMAELNTLNASLTLVGRLKTDSDTTIVKPRITPKVSRIKRSDFQLLKRALI